MSASGAVGDGLGGGRRRAQVLICVDVEGASVIEKRAAAEKLVAAKAAAASSASRGAGEDAGAQPVGSHVVTRGTSFANAPRFKSKPKPSGEADETEGASTDAADKSREGADASAAKPADAADDKSADAAKSEMPAKPADDKPAEAAKPEAPAKPEAKRESSFANAPRFKPKPKPKPREEADASASSSDSFSSARNAFAKPSGAQPAPESSASSSTKSTKASKPAESSKSSKPAKPAASREPVGADAAHRVSKNSSGSRSSGDQASFARPFGSPPAPEDSASPRPASSRSSSRSSSRISSADPAPARSSKASSSRRSKYEPRVKQMVFSDKDQLEQYREMAERDNAWALKENENARYRTAKVYDYDPRPLTGLAPGTIISCERSDARVIVGPESTWHAEDWHGGVALAYRGKPFGVVNEKEIRGLREIPVRVGGLLPGYKGIPETSLYIREDDAEQFPLKDPEKYCALNNKPAGRELIADTTVDLVGEEEVQFLLEALGEGWVWLTAYLDYFETGKHEGEPCVCFKLDGCWCGHLTAMMSERYWQAVCNRESTVCLAKIVEGPNKYELKAKLPSRKAIQDFYGR